MKPLKITSKYRNVKKNGFDSKKEYNRYQELKLLEKAGEISLLRCQPKYLLQEGFTDIMGNKHRPIYYVADFVYHDKKYNWQNVVEDVKSEPTKTPYIELKKVIS